MSASMPSSVTAGRRDSVSSTVARSADSSCAARAWNCEVTAEESVLNCASGEKRGGRTARSRCCEGEENSVHSESRSFSVEYRVSSSMFTFFSTRGAFRYCVDSFESR